MSTQKYAHRFTFAFLLVLSLAGLTINSNAATLQQERGRRNTDINRRELHNFDRFLDAHAAINADLKKDPTLINNATYLTQHPDLQQFLNSHPGVREEVKESPRYFERREQRFENKGRDITGGEVKNFDGFLDSHPEVASELKKDPRLIDNQDFLNSHPELREFLSNHPGGREEFKEHPRRFMNKEKHNEKREDKRKDRREGRHGERREERRGERRERP